jgi:hypothetical protein
VVGCLALQDLSELADIVVEFLLFGFELLGELLLIGYAFLDGFDFLLLLHLEYISLYLFEWSYIFYWALSLRWTSD